MKLSSILLNLANFTDRIRQLEYKLGLIDDYVVDYGTSNIWTYRKWASGIAECWGTAWYYNLTINRAYGSVYVAQAGNEQGNIDFPFTFAYRPVITKSVDGGNQWILGSSDVTTTNTGTFWICRAAASSNVTVGVSIMVKGLWKNMGGVIKGLFYKLFPVRGCLA